MRTEGGGAVARWRPLGKAGEVTVERTGRLAAAWRPG
jgi:hypothetical protein